MEEKKNNPEVIDLRIIAKKIWAKKKLFYKVLPITFVLSCIYILGFPRYYSTDIKLAPEMENAMSGSIGSLASSFGFDLGNSPTGDAIYPSLYPDLMEDNGFVTGLFNIKVVSEDEDIKTTYYNYLKYHQKNCIWSYPQGWIFSLFKTSSKGGKSGKFNPYILSEDDNNIVEIIRSNILFGSDEKTGVISIRVKAQDALICKTLADSVKNHLQDFITEYRTNKARIDYDYYKQLSIEAKQDYERTRQRYGAFVDGNTNIAMQSVRLKAEEMESEMELKFNTYSIFNNQMQAAKAKVQERTPAFTVIKGASMPIKPAGPKRMMFVLFMMILVTMITVITIVREDLFKIITVREKDK